jgi:lipopolysaccharide export system protein LptC
MRRAISVLGVLAWVGCMPRRAPDEATPPPMATLTGIHFEYFQGRDLAAVGRASDVTYERTTGDLTASQVVVRIASRGDPGALRPAVGGMELSAPTVVGNLFRKQAEGSRGVVMRTGAGIVAHTEKARIDGQSMRAAGKDPVLVEGPGYTLTADSFQSSLTDGEYEFEGRVSSQFGRKR